MKAIEYRIIISDPEDIAAVCRALERSDAERDEKLHASILRQISDNSGLGAEMFRQAAKKQWERGGELEIDDGAGVYYDDRPGAWVQAWLRVDESPSQGNAAFQKE